jgi:enoyl-CoA hydratase/carnithine racemase
MTDSCQSQIRSSQSIIVTHRDNGCSIVTLNRPEKRNCISMAMWRDLITIFGELGNDRSVRVIILTGAGGHFSAGADISEFDKFRNDANAAELYESEALQALVAIRNCQKPTIAVISGACVGGGCSLALACDLRVADKTARVGITAARIGIVYTQAEIELLLSAVSLSDAKRIMFTGALFSGEDAFEMKLVNMVSNDAASEAASICRSIAENAPLSVVGAKCILNAVSAGNSANHADEIERRIRDAAESEDYAEGRRAFAEKRHPRFKGI